MNNYYVFFDVDGTLLNCKTLFSFLKFWHIRQSKIFMGIIKYAFFYIKVIYWDKCGKPREFINSQYYRIYRNTDLETLNMQIKSWWNKISKKKNVKNMSIFNELLKHQNNGAKIVLVSGSMDRFLRPMMCDENIEYCLASEMIVKSNRLTGKLRHPPTVGKGKADRIMHFLKQHKALDKLNLCHAYGDHISDLPMLELVGNPVVVGKASGLNQIAKNRNWKIIN